MSGRWNPLLAGVLLGMLLYAAVLLVRPDAPDPRAQWNRWYRVEIHCFNAWAINDSTITVMDAYRTCARFNPLPVPAGT